MRYFIIGPILHPAELNMYVKIILWNFDQEKHDTCRSLTDNLTRKFSKILARSVADNLIRKLFNIQVTKNSQEINSKMGVRVSD